MKADGVGPPESLRRSRPSHGRPFQLHLGQLVHASIGQCLQQAQRTGTRPIVDIGAIAEILAADRLRHDSRRGELLLRSYVRSYLDDFVLPSPWSLLAVERRLSNGRIDLLFRNTWTDEVIGDEIKAGRGRPRGLIERGDLEQVGRYVRQLHAEFGQNLLGVRLIMLGPPAQAHVFGSIADVARTLDDLGEAAR